ncbi:MAG: exonuclease domain-containing protein, partial [Luteolibacter sp.]
LERWETLVDPGSPIPPHITQLTGITDDMVAAAPTFEAIADELEAWLDDCVFVAHNVGFDYAFIRGHFEVLGRVWKRPKLCTVRMARKLLPGHASYSLGRICQDLGIENEARHRAMGDAAATVELFHHMMAQADAAEWIDRTMRRGERESWLPQHVDASDFEALPAAPGVYRFLNQKGTPIYIGMSHNVRHRVRTHFSGSMKSARRQAFLRDIYRIEGESTGSVLMARLIEDELIRPHWPIHNRAQKSIPTRVAILSYIDQRGFIRFHLQRQRHVKHAIRWFRREDDARQWLHTCAAELNLDPELLGLGSDGTGKTIPEEMRDAHNLAMESLIQRAQQRETWAIVDKGRDAH